MKKDLDPAIEHLEKALNLVKENPRASDQKQNPMFFILSTLGSSYSEKKMYDQMFQYWEEAVRYLEDHQDSQENKKQLGHLLNNLGMQYY